MAALGYIGHGYEAGGTQMSTTAMYRRAVCMGSGAACTSWILVKSNSGRL